MLHYIASKGAILSMTRSLATEFGDDNVLVNAVSPGLTIPESVAEAGHVTGYFQEAAMAARLLKRPAVADDVAHVILFFASNDVGLATVTTVTADGGSRRDEGRVREARGSKLKTRG